MVGAVAFWPLPAVDINFSLAKAIHLLDTVPSQESYLTLAKSYSKCRYPFLLYISITFIYVPVNRLNRPITSDHPIWVVLCQIGHTVMICVNSDDSLLPSSRIAVPIDCLHGKLQNIAYGQNVTLFPSEGVEFEQSWYLFQLLFLVRPCWKNLVNFIILFSVYGICCLCRCC